MKEYLSIPGHLPIQEAAQRLQLSRVRVRQYVHAGRLPSRKVHGRYMIAERDLDAFERFPQGRIRRDPVAWRRYLPGTSVYTRILLVPILPGCEQALTEHIAALAETQRHTFPGTMARYIFVEAGMLHVVLVWKSTEARFADVDRDVAAFREALADLVDWERARDETSEVMAHT